MLIRTDVINHLIEKYKYKTYLEIGIADRDLNFNQIKAPFKIDVDPRCDCEYKMTSDDFFKQNGKTFNIIFIDGLHVEEQVTKDILNSLEALSFGGTIVVHDSLPLEESHQKEYDFNTFDDIDDFYKHLRTQTPIWNGTVWKAIAKLKGTRDDLIIHTIDTADAGCTIISRGQMDLVTLPGNLSWRNYKLNKKLLLGIISNETFLNEI